jgi:hypothetical protein
MKVGDIASEEILTSINNWALNAAIPIETISAMLSIMGYRVEEINGEIIHMTKLGSNLVNFS